MASTATEPEIETDLFDRIRRLREDFEKSLKSHQPVVVLASLSVAVAALLRATSPDASIVAATAGLLFLVELITSVINDLSPLEVPILLGVGPVFFAGGLALLAAALVVIIAGVTGALVAIFLLWSIGNVVTTLSVFGFFKGLERLFPREELRAIASWRFARRSVVFALTSTLLQVSGNVLFLVPGIPREWSIGVLAASTAVIVLALAFAKIAERNFYRHKENLPADAKDRNL